MFNRTTTWRKEYSVKSRQSQGNKCVCAKNSYHSYTEHYSTACRSEIVSLVLATMVLPNPLHDRSFNPTRRSLSFTSDGDVGDVVHGKTTWYHWLLFKKKISDCQHFKLKLGCCQHYVRIIEKLDWVVKRSKWPHSRIDRERMGESRGNPSSEA